MPSTPTSSRPSPRSRSGQSVEYYDHPRRQHSDGESDGSSGEDDKSSTGESSDGEDDHSPHEQSTARGKSRTVLWVGLLVGLVVVFGLGFALWVGLSGSKGADAGGTAPASLSGISAAAAGSGSTAVAAGSSDGVSATTNQGSGTGGATKTGALPSASGSAIVSTPPSSAVTPAPGSGPAASIAAASSMTAASVPSFAFPSAPLPTDSALAFIKKSWPYKSGTSDYLSFVVDPLGGTELVLEIDYPAGGYAEHNPGGVSGMHFDVFGAEGGMQRAIMSYEVGFSKGFDFVFGGKLPGLYGGDEAGGCSGGRHSDICFSLRLMWRQAGMGEVYAYIPTYTNFCDATMECNDEYGFSIDRGSWNFTSGGWTTVTEIAVLNSSPGPSGEANGVLSVYAGSTLAFTKNDVVFRTNTSVAFSSFFVSSFFGGSTDPKFAGKGGSSYFKNFQFFAGSAPSTGTGTVVTASMPG